MIAQETRTFADAGHRLAAPRWRALRAASRNWLVVFGALLGILFVLMAAIPELFATHNPYSMQVQQSMSEPSTSTWLGTDSFGRDVWSRIAHGARISLGIAFLAVGAAVLIGTTLGVIGGYVGGAIDQILGRTMDIFFGFPTLLLAIAVAGILGPSVRNAILAISVVYLPFFFRTVRGPVLVEREREYIQAAQALGASGSRVLIRHMLPNVLTPVVVQTSITLSYAILIEASLSYLGLGVQPPEPSWGTILNEGRPYLQLAPWISVFPGVAIMLAVMGFNLLGDGLRDLWDPRTGS